MSRYFKRWMIGASIAIFWLVMMGLLLAGELGVRRLEIEDRARPRLAAATESWLGISLTEGQRVGHVHLRQAPENRHDLTGSRMRLHAQMRLELLEKQSDLEVSGSVWQADDGARVEFDFTVRSAGYDFEIAGEVANGELRSEMTSAGETLPLRLPVDEGLIFSSGLGSALSFPQLDVGEEYRLDTFDPVTLSKSSARVKCTARETLRLAEGEVETCRLTVAMNGFSSLAWIDAAGEVVRAQTPIGLVLERITAAEARAATGDGPAAEGWLDRTAIRPTGQQPFRSARTMTVELRGLEDLDLPEDDVQTALGEGRYRLDSPPVPPAPPAAANSPDLDSYLVADAFVQSDHPKIVRQAAAIASGETDPWLKARKIHDWVFSRLDKEPVISVPSALEVLKQQRGDCNEHTILFTALARAAALPTRIAIGIVWSDELEGFYYHAWPEVHLGEWVWMDPTLDQPVADATHVKLLVGGIESWPRLLPYLGRLEVEVLAVE